MTDQELQQLAREYAEEFGIPFKKFMRMALKESVYDWYEENKNINDNE